MQLPSIKCYNGFKPANSFYVLCKGLNAGKPLREPCPNCFTVTCQTPDEFIYWYNLTWGVWKAKGFHVRLLGSVIPFIRLADYREIIWKASQAVKCKESQLKQVIDAMQAIEVKEQVIKQQLLSLTELKSALFRSLVRM